GLVGAHVVDRQDVRMIERARRLRFIGETPPPRRVGAGVREDLDGDVAVQPWVPRTIHLPHAACTQQRDDFIGTGPTRWLRGHLVVRPPLYAYRATRSID